MVYFMLRVKLKWGLSTVSALSELALAWIPPRSSGAIRPAAASRLPSSWSISPGISAWSPSSSPACTPSANAYSQHSRLSEVYRQSSREANIASCTKCSWTHLLPSQPLRNASSPAPSVSRLETSSGPFCVSYPVLQHPPSSCSLQPVIIFQSKIDGNHHWYINLSQAACQRHPWQPRCGRDWMCPHSRAAAATLPCCRGSPSCTPRSRRPARSAS